jgi:hypothetical protein
LLSVREVESREWYSRLQEENQQNTRRSQERGLEGLAELVSPYLTPAGDHFVCNRSQVGPERRPTWDKWKLVLLTKLVLRAASEAGSPPILDAGNLLQLVRSCDIFRSDDIDLAFFHRFFDADRFFAALSSRGLEVTTFGSPELPGFEMSATHKKYPGVKVDMRLLQETPKGWWQALWIDGSLGTCFMPGPPADYVLVELNEAVPKDQSNILPAKDKIYVDLLETTRTKVHLFVPTNLDFQLTWSYGPVWRRPFPETYQEPWHWVRSRRWNSNFCDVSNRVSQDPSEPSALAQLDSTYKQWTRSGTWDRALSRLESAMKGNSALWQSDISPEELLTEEERLRVSHEIGDV